MNGGSRTRGQADGFELDILPKLKDYKAKASVYLSPKVTRDDLLDLRQSLLLFVECKGSADILLMVSITGII